MRIIYSIPLIIWPERHLYINAPKSNLGALLQKCLKTKLIAILINLAIWKAGVLVEHMPHIIVIIKIQMVMKRFLFFCSIIFLTLEGLFLKKYGPTPASFFIFHCKSFLQQWFTNWGFSRDKLCLLSGLISAHGRESCTLEPPYIMWVFRVQCWSKFETICVWIHLFHH